MISLNSRDRSTQAGWIAALNQHQLLYPDERVVSFFARRFPNVAENCSLNGLDIGFGSGRHLKLMLDYGFQTWGIDYGENAVSLARASLAHDALLRELVLGDFRQYAFPVKFDVLIAWGVLFNNPPSEMLSNLRGMVDLLAEGGRIFLNFRTRENSLYGLGKEIEPGCFILDERTGPYNGICYTFMDLPEIAQMSERAGLEIVMAEKTTLSKNNLAELHSWLQVEFVRQKA